MAGDDIAPMQVESTDNSCVAPESATVSVSDNQAIDLSGDGGVTKKILREGHGDSMPPKGSKVSVHYVGRLLTGEKFDSSRDRDDPFEFSLGKGSVIKGWDIGVATMKQGELAVLTCAADYAYGASGSPPKIPANATLEFEVELLSWEEGEEADTVPEKLALAQKKKAAGNDAFKAGDLQTAVRAYEKGLQTLEYMFGADDAQTKEADALKVAMNLNTALCQTKLGRFSDAIKSCDKVLKIESKNVKAYFRRGQAHLKSGEFELAQKDLTEALQLDPANKDVRTELETLKRAVAEHKKKEKAIFGGMFEKMAKMSATTAPAAAPTATATEPAAATEGGQA